MRCAKRIRFLYIIAVVVITTIHSAAAYDMQYPDKILVSKKVTGHLFSYQEGDYLHAIVRTKQGSERSFFVDDEICFLALNRKEVLAIEYNEIERFFSEGGGYYPANIIQSISTKAGEKRWIRKISAKPTAAERKECSRVLRTLFIHRTLPPNKTLQPTPKKRRD